MKEKDPIKTLQDNVEIPGVVQNKIDGTLLKIKGEANNSKIVAYSNKEAKTAIKNGKRRFGMVAAIAALVITTVSVGAAVYRNWSKGLEEALHVTEEQKAKLEENKTTTIMDQGSTDSNGTDQGNTDQVITNQVATDQGITITAIQSITDNYYTYIAFKVEGFEVADDEEPFFEETSATVVGDDNDQTTAEGGFYDGLVTGPNGNVTNADGTPIGEDENGRMITHYKQADGSLEYHLTIRNSEMGKGYLINKKVHIEFDNLGTVEKAEYFNRVTGKWTFDIDLRGSDETRVATVNVPLDDTGATVIGAEISPISIGATYNFPYQTRTEELPEDEAKAQAEAEGVDVSEIETIFEVPTYPPDLMGVKMKDGTLYPYLYMGPGSMGYTDENPDVCYTRFAIDRILDPSQVEALLFFKSYAGDGIVPTEDNFYVVPIS